MMRILGGLFFGVGIVLTVFICFLIYKVAIAPTFERKWVQIPSPAEPLESLKLNDTGEVLADGENGGLYQFYEFPQPVWKKVTKPEDTHSSSVDCGPISAGGYTSLPLAGEVKSHVSEACGFAEQSNSLEVSLLESGETWFLTGSSNSYATIGLLFILIIGIPLNIVVYGIGLFFFGIDLGVRMIRWSKKNESA